MTRMSVMISRQAATRRRRTAAARSATARAVAVPVPSGRHSSRRRRPIDLACSTCSAAGEPTIDALPGAMPAGVRPARCPACGVTSIELGLVVAIDAVLADLGRLDRLAREV